MDNTKQPVNIISFCTGMRGIERGLERIMPTIRAICYVEIEAFICENLVQQMEQGVLDPAPIFTDLKKFDGTPFCGKVHGITAGWPCQPFSVAGKQLGDKDPRHLWPFIKEHVRTIQPFFVFGENVPGHLTLGYREVRSDLEQLGYTVEEGIFSSEEVGAPHQRKRLFILAVAHSRCHGLKQDNEISARRNSVESESERKLANASGARNKTWISGSINREEGDSRIIDNESMDLGVGQADTEEFRMERNRSEGKQISKVSVGEEIFRRNSRRDQWPAPPGPEQFEWEAPRLESNLGLTINGYNFREDLLRMAGNGVVEQTAELAFRTLLTKHGLTL